MHAGERSPRPATWFSEPDHFGANRRTRASVRDDSASLRAIVASSLFLVVFTAALIFGGHAAIHPLLRMATSARAAEATGNMVYPMPDGEYCRHMTFDNATLRTTEGAIEPCPTNIGDPELRRTGRGFVWGMH